MFSVMRGLVLGGKISEIRALESIRRLPQLAVDHVSLDALLPMMWEMRSAISAYDAPYVALATTRGVTLVTSNARLARAAIGYCRVELVA